MSEATFRSLSNRGFDAVGSEPLGFERDGFEPDECDPEGFDGGRFDRDGFPPRVVFGYTYTRGTNNPERLTTVRMEIQ